MDMSHYFENLGEKLDASGCRTPAVSGFDARPAHSRPRFSVDLARMLSMICDLAFA